MTQETLPNFIAQKRKGNTLSQVGVDKLVIWGKYIFDKKRRDEVFLTHEPSQIHGSMIPIKTD